MAETLTVDETSFPNAKPRETRLIAYKAFADLAGKSSLFVITIVAARRLSPEAFGLFALGSTLGWMVAVITDFGIQLHVARAVAWRRPMAPRCCATWLRVRLWTSGRRRRAGRLSDSSRRWLRLVRPMPIAVFTADV